MTGRFETGIWKADETLACSPSPSFSAVIFLSTIFLSKCLSPPASHAADVRSFLQKDCVECHGAEQPASVLRLDRLDPFRNEDRHLWTLVHEKLSSGEMPPKEQARPDAAEQRRVRAWIVEQQ